MNCQRDGRAYKLLKKVRLVKRLPLDGLPKKEEPSWIPPSPNKPSKSPTPTVPIINSTAIHFISSNPNISSNLIRK
jgi:hypothetical protein